MMWPEAYVSGVVGVGGTGEERDRIVPIQPTEQTLLTNPGQAVPRPEGGWDGWRLRPARPRSQRREVSSRCTAGAANSKLEDYPTCGTQLVSLETRQGACHSNPCALAA